MNVTSLVPQMMSLIKSHRFVSLVLFSIILTLVIFATYIIAGGLRQQSTDAGFIMPHVFQGISLPDPVISPTDTTVEKSSILIDTTQSPSNSPAVSSQVNINGKTLSVPKTGTVHNVVQDTNGVTIVDISVNSSETSGKSNSTSATSVRLDSTTGSSIDIQEVQ